MTPKANTIVYLEFSNPDYFLSSLLGKFGRKKKESAYGELCIDMRTGEQTFAEDDSRSDWKYLIPIRVATISGLAGQIDDLWDEFKYSYNRTSDYLDVFKKLAVFASEYFKGHYSVSQTNNLTDWGCYLALRHEGHSYWTDCGMEYDSSLSLLGIAEIGSIRYLDPDAYLKKERENFGNPLGLTLTDKLAKARANLQYDPEKVDDGIRMAQWKEWEGETVTLDPEETKWVYKQLKKLFHPS